MVYKPKTRIEDVAIAAALMSWGYKIITATVDFNGTMFFEVYGTIDTDRAIRKYESKRMYVQAKTFADNIKLLVNRAQLNS